MTKVERRLRTFALIACFGTVAPLLLHFAGLFEMKASFPAIALPCLLGLILTAVLVRRQDAPTFWSRFAFGAAAGLVATLAYDLVRVGGLLMNFPGFAIIAKFGQMITGIDNDTTFTAAVGWLYHFSNGTVFGVIYCLAVGPGSLWAALVWGIALEGAMLASYPRAFAVDMSIGSPGLLWSVLGHLGYGFTLGVLARKWLRAPQEAFGAP